MLVAETEEDAQILKSLVAASEDVAAEFYERGDIEVSTTPPRLGLSDQHLGIVSRPGLLYVVFGR
jgi:hypothetical protein